MTLADSWRRWLAENLLGGARVADVFEALAERGVPRQLAAREIAALESSPLWQPARDIADEARRRELVLRLRAELAALGAPLTIERLPNLDREELRSRYYRGNTPVVLTELTRGWPALDRWGLDDLEARFGDAEVEITSGRADDPWCDMNFSRHLERVTVRELCVRLRAAEASATNDFYLIANNHALDRSALGALLDDVVRPDCIAPQRSKGDASLWIGPRGTLTRLHHDTCNILFCQIVGRKRFRLTPPWETRLLDTAMSFYSTASPELRAQIDCGEVVLAPGEALFLPVGWWHEVEALDFSMSVSLLDFELKNSFEWYAPGSPSHA
jgi:hypothetical protein